MGKPRSKKVLVIGWDAADWKVINPLMSEGKMPALKRLMEGGVYGRIQTLDPPLSPMLWTSIATGFRADIHGVGGFIEPLPDGSGLRPVTSTSRKVKAIWNILNQEGKKSNVVTWWPSNPVEPINGVMVSNLFQIANKPLGQEWDMPKGTIHPKEMEDELKDFRVHPHEITLAMAVPFIPNLKDDKELRKSKRAGSTVKVIAHAATVHAASTHLQANTEWDFMAVYHDAIDHFCHLAMRFHPPYRPELKQEDYDNFNHVVEAGYRFQDMMLERTLDLLDDDTTVILLSDHGFHSDHQRPLTIPNEPSGPAVEHSPYGIIVMSGPGIKKGGVEISGSSVLDITPTILALYGLPVGQDMEGKVLYQAFEDPTQADFIESWEKVPGESGMHSKDQIEDPWAAQEALQQLVELGYIEPMGDDIVAQVEKARRESEYYVARNMINGGRIKPAIEKLEKIFEESKTPRFGQRLAFAYLSQRMFIKCQNMIAELRVLEIEEREKARKVALKKKAETEGKKEEEIDPMWMEEIEEPLYLDYLEGLLYLAINQPWKAMPFLQKVQEKNRTNAEVPINIGKILNLKKKYKDAEKQFVKALAIDDRHAGAHYGLGITFLRRRKFHEALDELLLAVGENFYLPHAHYYIGEALVRLKDYESAAQAFEVTIRLAPGMSKAHKWLYDIYTNHLNEPAKAAACKKFLENNIRGEVIIVTGLPHAGVTEVMEMLEAGGQSILKDGEGDNVKGHRKVPYLLSKVQRLSTDNSWMDEAKGKVLQVYVEHLTNLPPHFDYKVIFVNRDLDEIVLSQKKLASKEKTKGALPIDLLTKFQNQLDKFEEWIASQPNMQRLNIEQKELAKRTKDNALVIAEFLGKELDIAEMEKVYKLKKHD